MKNAISHVATICNSVAKIDLHTLINTPVHTEKYDTTK